MSEAFLQNVNVVIAYEQLTFESRARAEKSKAIARGGVVKRRQESELTFSSRGFAARFRARGSAARAFASILACAPT